MDLSKLSPFAIFFLNQPQYNVVKIDMRILDSIIACVLLLITLFGFASHKVILGIDQLMTPKYFNQIAGKRIAVLTNFLAMNSRGQRTIDLLLNSKKIKVNAIFKPEGGLIVGQKLNKTNLKSIPIYSIYKPKASQIGEAMKHIDIIIYDLQAVGVRYYTFVTSLALIMQKAKQYHKEIIVLDRPNPLNGLYVGGATTAKKNIGKMICYYPIPMQYGLTIGELGHYFNKYFIKDVDYSVIPMRHWTRGMLFPQTGLRWIPPSSALATFQQTFIYGILGSLEGMNLAIGRGMAKTEKFLNYGAPYISMKIAKKIVTELQISHLSGLKFALASWVPTDDIYTGKRCNGFRVSVTNYHKVRRFYSMIRVIQVLYQNLGKKLNINHAENWIGAPWVADVIIKGYSTKDIVKHARLENSRYINNSFKVRIYKDQ